MKHLKTFKLFEKIDSYDNEIIKEWFEAIYNYDIVTIERLIDSGLDVNIKEPDGGYSALQLAVMNAYYDGRLVKLLLKQPNIYTGYVLLSAANHCHEEEIFLMLLAVPDIKISLKDDDGNEENFIELLNNNYVDNEHDLSFLINYDLQKTFIDNKRIDIIRLFDEYDLIDADIKKNFPYIFTATDLELI